jgi:hypothetical protein
MGKWENEGQRSGLVGATRSRGLAARRDKAHEAMV